MTSTSITKVGGVVVVTQVIPRDETSITLQTPAAAATTAQQAPPPDARAPPTVPTSPSKMDDMTATFLRGQPHGLGVVQIFIGVLCILFSLTSVLSQLLIVHAPFCVAVTFVVSGSLALAAGRRTSVTLVWACLVSNVVSAVVSLGGVVYLCWLLAARRVSRQFCETSQDISGSDEWIRCNRNMWILDVVMYGLLSSLLVLLLLQLCVAITVCVFSGKTIRHRGHASPIMVRADEYRSLLSAAALQPGSSVALLDSEAAETSGLPPNAP